MKILLTVIRWFIGLLFIFSGLVKANDPLGLSYKMQEFFEVWGWTAFHDYTLAFSIIMNVLEVGAGVAVIIGWQKRMVSWLLLLLIIFFTFLTGYALLSGKIKTCGCFGDCLPLTPAQSFGKDLVLLVLILLVFFSRNVSYDSKLKTLLVFLAVIFTTAFQFYVLRYLPYVDCLPFKKGNNIQEQMKVPPGAVPDSLSIVFKYKKDGKEIEFDQLHFPNDFDSTYQYIDRIDKIVKKGNGLKAPIADFSLQTPEGTDVTSVMFMNETNYVLVMAKDMDNVKEWRTSLEKLIARTKEKKMLLFLVTAESEKAAKLFPGLVILKCDAIVIKTAARVRPTYFLMNGATIKEKLSYAVVDKLDLDLK